MQQKGGRSHIHVHHIATLIHSLKSTLTSITVEMNPANIQLGIDTYQTSISDFSFINTSSINMNIIHKQLV